MNHHEIVKNLIGGIRPVGESHTDEARFKNLEDTILLINNLVFDVAQVALGAGNHQASVSKAGKRAVAFLTAIYESLEEDLTN